MHDVQDANVLTALQSVAVSLEKAKVPEDVFGKLDAADPIKTLAFEYRRLVRFVHPDKFEGTESARLAHDLFLKLTDWKNQAERKIKAGTYGDRKPALPEETPPTFHAPQQVKTPRRTYLVDGLITRGDLADLYSCAYTEKGVEHRDIFKVAQSPADNDLLENESKVLGAIYPMAQVSEKFYRYLPKLLDTFVLRGASRTNRRVNVLVLADGYVSLAQIIAAHPKGLDFRDMAWMFKRVLAGLGFVHRKGYVHGALTPEHILVHPTGHGAKLVDWCYSVKTSEKLKVICKPYRDFYPAEVFAKRPTTPQTDLYMAAKCMVAVLGGPDSDSFAQAPVRVQAFLGSCLLAAQSKRPDDAWKLHEEFDQLLVRLVGKPKYRPLVMPAR